MKRSIAIGGSIAQKPGRGGHTCVFLQYLLGSRQLGWDVVFLDRLEPEMCRNEAGAPVSLGKPVIAQDTGFSDTLPTGEGILAFTTHEEAADAVLCDPCVRAALETESIALISYHDLSLAMQPTMRMPR